MIKNRTHMRACRVYSKRERFSRPVAPHWQSWHLPWVPLDEVRNCKLLKMMVCGVFGDCGREGIEMVISWRNNTTRQDLESKTITDQVIQLHEFQFVLPCRDLYNRQDSTKQPNVSPLPGSLNTPPISLRTSLLPTYTTRTTAASAYVASYL